MTSTENYRLCQYSLDNTTLASKIHTYPYLSTQSPPMQKFFLPLLFILIAWQATAQITKAELAIKAVTIVDLQRGILLPGKTVLVSRNKIVAVINQGDGRSYQASQTIDARGKFIIPGLWDMHMHFGGGDTLVEENKNLLSLYLANGITSIRDCAADISPSVLEWRKAVANGSLKGPSIYTSGPKLEGYKSIWVGDIEIDNSQELALALDSLQKLSVDFIKITDNTLKPALYLESIQQARKRGWPVTGHIPAALTLSEVSNAGLSAIEHITYLLRAGSANEAAVSQKIGEGKMTAKEYNQQLLASFDTTRATSIYRLLAKNKTAVVPTLSISFAVAYLDQVNHTKDPELAYIGQGLKNTYNWRIERAAKDDAAATSYRHELIERAAGLLPILQKTGVTLLAGTDAGYLNSFDYPGFALHQELALMVKYGLSPLQALRASVVNGPAFMGKASAYGSVSTGKQADLLLLDENPLENIAATRKIFAVVCKGKLFTRAALDSLLEDVKQKAANSK